MKRSFNNSRHSLIGMFLLGIAVFFCIRPADLYAAGPTPDNFTTTSYSSLPSNAMSAMAYGNNVYIAVGYYGAIVKSADAETWVNVKTKADINYTGVTAPGSFTFNGAAYGNGLFVVTGSEGVILTSPDGNTWTQRSSGVTTGIWSTEFLTFNGSSAFYATTQGKLLTSPDGISWTPIVPTGVDSSLTLTKVTVGNGGTRLAVGGANGRIYSTTNGTAWTSAQPSTDEGQSIGTNMLTWMNDRYYISDPRAYIWTSTDLSTFTLLGPPFKQNASQHNNQMFNGFYDGTKYYMFGYESPNYGAVYTSANGTTWTMQPFKNYFVTQNARFLNGKYFRLGNEGMLVSSDGADWRYKWGGVFTEIVHGSGSQYVAVGKTGGDGAIWNSTDLADWNQVTLSTRTTGFTAAAYGNNTYVAAGETNQTTTALATSPDGSTWTLRSSINDSTSITDIAFGNGKFVAVGSGAGGPKIKTSADGIAWHEPTLPAQSIDAVYSIAYTNNQFIALGYGYSDEGYLNAASIWTSPDGESWSNRSGTYPNQTDGFNNLLYDGSKYVLTGYDSSTYEVFSRSSDDLITWSSPTLTGTYTNFSSSAMLGQKGNNLYMLVYDSSNNPVVYYTADHGSTWQNAGVDMSSIDPNLIYSLMEANGRVILSGNSQLVMTTTGTMAQAEAPTANPAGGAVASGTTVVLSSSTSGAAIHYTLDGSVPTGSSPAYSGPIPVTSAVTIKAIAVKAGMTDSAVMSEAYTIMAQAEAPTANPAGGAVAPGTTVVLSSPTSGAAIHYTLDGSVPTGSSPAYSGPIPVTSAVTIKAIAVKAGMADSAVMSEAYTIMAQAEAPTANPAGGAVAPGTTVALSSPTSGAAIHYTLDGSVPTGSSPAYSGPIPVTSAVTIKAIAVKAGMADSAVMSEAYTIMAQAEAPTANPAGGAVASGTTVVLSSSISGAAIHYTLDGSVPTGSSPAYSGPIPVTSAVTIKAIAVKAGMADSAVMSEAYTIMAQAEAPTANPAGGAVASGTTVVLSSSTSGAAIHYTLDGSVPTGSSPAYSGPIPVTSAVTIKAIAVKAGMTDSAVMSEAYTIMAQAEAPTANPAGGAVASGTTVALSSPTGGAAIHYTLDGSVPTGSSPAYSGPITVTSAVTIKAIAVKAGMTDSAVMSEAYTISAEPETDSVISPVSAVFDKKQTQQADVNIELTLNGNTLAGISNGIANLTAGTDYTLSGSTVTISKAYLASLATGTTSLTFRFSAGAAQTLEITITDTTVPVPGVPLLQSAVFGNAQVQLIWTPVEGSTGYKIFQRLADAEYGSEVGTVSGSVYSYNAVNLMNGTTYYFVVKAANAEGDSAASNELSATPKTAPGAPANVTAVSGNELAVVSFTAPDSDGGSPITGYEVTSSPGNIVAYGTASPITVIGLTNGTAYTFTVKAVNSAGSSAASALSNAVTPVAPFSGGGDTSPAAPAVQPVATVPPAATGFDILVNDKAENAGTVVTGSVNGQTALTVVIDQAKLEEKLAAEAQGAVITIPVTMKSDIVIAELNGQMVKNMEDKQAVLELKSENATYTLPAGQINMDAIRSQFGTAVALGDIKVKLEIAAPKEDTLRIVGNSAVQGGFTLVVPPLNFVVRAEYGGQTIEISRFNAYVERQIALPDGVDPNKITTAIVVEPNGSVRHVPTKVTTMDQKYYAKVNSLTNSTYSIIWHPLQFKDVAGHWAKDIVNNMGSRLIIDGTGNGLFDPDADITRAEFAAVIVRGLGLKLDSSAASFADVKAGAWYSSAVQTAYAYNLINGFEDGTFRPADKITREQAMAIIAKAMKLTSLKDKLPVQSSAELLSPFKDAGKVSHWAQSSAADSIAAGIVSGRSASELAPQAYITRAEVAAIIQRLLQKSNLI
ncbi:chitobiase/beta-hexosaminidase C-terminal domain-containing protein [Paenibacillus graminis]|nr:chitobiase/beta-hexosaminidase C-terminal domain-containing protein [Paenibacillus graminis]